MAQARGFRSSFEQIWNSSCVVLSCSVRTTVFALLAELYTNTREQMLSGASGAMRASTIWIRLIRKFRPQRISQHIKWISGGQIMVKYMCPFNMHLYQINRSIARPIAPTLARGFNHKAPLTKTLLGRLHVPRFGLCVLTHTRTHARTYAVTHSRMLLVSHFLYEKWFIVQCSSAESPNYIQIIQTVKARLDSGEIVSHSAAVAAVSDALAFLQ